MSAERTMIHRRTGPSRLQRALMAVGALLVIAIVVALLVDRIFFADSGTAVGTGSGVAATQARSVPPFTGVDLAGANNVVVRVGARRSVVVHADDNLLRRVTTRVRAGTLLVGTSRGNLDAESPMFVVVTTPSLDELRLGGAGNISASGIDSRRLTVAIPGSGNIEVSGTTRKLVVTMSGQGTALLRGLVAHDADAALGGSGTIMLTTTHRLGARVSGNGTITYGGDPPHVTQSVTGNGAVSAG